MDGIDYVKGRAAEVMGQLRERTDAKAAYDLDAKAVSAFEKCFAEHPKELQCLQRQFTALGRIGNILYDNKQYPDALAVYQHSLELAQDYARLVPPGRTVGWDSSAAATII